MTFGFREVGALLAKEFLAQDFLSFRQTPKAVPPGSPGPSSPQGLRGNFRHILSATSVLDCSEQALPESSSVNIREEGGSVGNPSFDPVH